MNSLWSTLRNVFVRLGSALTFVVLARILDKQEIGLFAAVLAIIAIIEMLAENGLGDAVVQSRSDDEAVLSTLLAMTASVGIVLAFALAVFAPQIERFFEAPGMARILPVCGLVVVMNSFAYIPVAIMRMRFQFRALALRAFAATAVGATLGLGGALLGFGVWSLVMQALGFAAVNLAFVVARRTFRPTPHLDLAGAGPLLRFGFTSLSNRTLLYATNRAIELVLAAQFGLVALAAFVVGTRLHFILAQLISSSLLDVVFSTLSQARNDPAAFREAFRRNLALVTLVAVPAFVGIALIARDLCVLVFGQNGDGASQYLVIVAGFGALQILHYFSGVVLAALGRPQDDTRALLLQAALSLLVLAAARWLGPYWTVFLNFAVVVPVVPFILTLALRAAAIPAITLSKVIAPVYGAAAVMVAAVEVARFACPGVASSNLASIALAVAVGALAYTGTLVLFSRGTLKLAFAELRGHRPDLKERAV